MFLSSKVYEFSLQWMHPGEGGASVSDVSVLRGAGYQGDVGDGSNVLPRSCHQPQSQIISGSPESDSSYRTPRGEHPGGIRNASAWAEVDGAVPFDRASH